MVLDADLAACSKTAPFIERFPGRHYNVGIQGRSFSHWIGGMGVLVFVLQILPMSSGQTMHLMRCV